MKPVVDCIGDLLQSGADYIVHQTNCVNIHGEAWGIARSIFDRWPHANIYNEENCFARAGTTIIVASTKDQNTSRPFIVNVFGQRYCGKPRQSEPAYRREQWFKAGLADFREQLREHQSLHSSVSPVKIAFPYGIGCGLAGGAWQEYRRIIEEFAEECKRLDFQVQIYIYKERNKHLRVVFSLAKVLSAIAMVFVAVLIYRAQR